jgi:hypothetical protein
MKLSKKDRRDLAGWNPLQPSLKERAVYALVFLALVLIGGAIDSQGSPRVPSDGASVVNSAWVGY